MEDPTTTSGEPDRPKSGRFKAVRKLKRPGTPGGGDADSSKPVSVCSSVTTTAAARAPRGSKKGVSSDKGNPNRINRMLWHDDA